MILEFEEIPIPADLARDGYRWTGYPVCFMLWMMTGCYNFQTEIIRKEYDFGNSRGASAPGH